MKHSPTLSKQTIAEIIYDAAHCYLWDGTKHGFHQYCCDAVYVSSAHPIDAISAKAFLDELGCDSGSVTQFHEFGRGEEKQGARFLFLEFARLVAEDEKL